MVVTNETVIISRVLRNNTVVRVNLTSSLLLDAITHYIPSSVEGRKSMVDAVAVIAVVEGAEAMEIATPANGESGSNKFDESEPRKSVIPEVEVYINWLVLLLLMRHKLYEQAAVSSKMLLKSVVQLNRFDFFFEMILLEPSFHCNTHG
jgi:hypothetical protein